MAAIIDNGSCYTIKTSTKMTALNVDKSPPMFTVLKDKDESFEDFFTKNFNKFVKRREHEDYNGTPAHESILQISCNGLFEPES